MEKLLTNVISRQYKRLENTMLPSELGCDSISDFEDYDTRSKQYLDYIFKSIQ